MSKSIALGLLGAGAILLAILLAGCTGAPSPTTPAGAAPTPAATAGPGATPVPTPTPTTAPTNTPTPEPTPDPGSADALAPTPATGAGDQFTVPERVELKQPKLGSALDDLIARIETGDVSPEEAAQEAPLHQGGSVAVTIHLSGNVDEVVRYLEANGGATISVGEDYIEALVPVLLLGQTSEQLGVLRVRLIEPGESSQSPSSVAGNGPEAHGSLAWNQAGYTGQGIKVGIIDGGFRGFSDLMGAELPQTVVARCYQLVGQPSENLADCEDTTSDHGTKVAESVIDIAPEVSLYISDPRTRANLRDAVDWMISEGVSVINHSVSWTFDGPGDGTSPLSISPLNTVDLAVDSGVLWVNAAGNYAQKTWFQRGAYSDPDDDGIINFTMLDEGITVFLGEGRKSVELRWDDSWGEATRDFDLALYDALGTRVQLTADPQSGGGGHIPLERMIYTVPSRGLYSIAVIHRSGSVPDWIQLVVKRSVRLQYHTGIGSIINPAESANPGMLAVGAAHWSDVNSIESYSSRGPTPDGRVKPDIVGAACGETATSSSFCGTSQASPHVAGMAALVRQRFPGYSPEQVVAYLKENAEQRVSSPDPNSTWGHGFFVLPQISQGLPNAPAIGSVTPGASTLTVAWSAPSSDGGSAITAYDLRHIRSDAANKGEANWTVVQDVWTGAGALSYELTGLDSGVHYDVQMRAVNTGGDGPWSAVATGTTIASVTTPGAPGNLTATANVQTRIDLSWSAPSDDGGAAIAGYRIEVSTDGSAWSDLVVNTRSTSTSYSHTGLTAGSTRHYRVSASNSAGTGTASNVASATTGVAPVSDLVVETPTLDASAPAAGARFTLNATVRNQGSGRSASTTLRYYRSTDSTITTGDTAVGTDSVSGLNPSGNSAETISLTAPSTPGAHYYGACVDSVSDESDTTNNCSTAVTVTVGAAPAPDLVVDTPTVSESRPTAGASFTLNATVRNQGSGRSASTTLRYYRSTDSTITTGDTAVGTDSVNGLNPSGNSAETISLTAPSTPGAYYYGACVDTVSDESETTNNCSPAATVTVQGTNQPPRLTGEVDDKVVELGESFTVDLSGLFTDPDGDEITDYGFTYGTRGILSGTLTPATGILSLRAIAVGETIVAVDASDSNGQWGRGDLFKATVVAAAPGAPTGLTATANGQTRIDLSWRAPSSDGGAAIAGYRIEVSTDGSAWSDLVVNTRSTSTSYSHTGLTAGSTRHYRVSSINSAGTGAAFNTANATTDPATAPDDVCATGGAVPDAANNPGLVSDCEALLAGKDTLVGTGTLNWSADVPMVNWDGVSVGNSPTRVLRLDLAENQLTGEIPPELGDLTNLESLVLNNNELTGPIPAALGDLTNLRALNLWSNELTGPIPAALGDLTNLESLNLGWNELTGSIPAWLGDLSNLVELVLPVSQLTGPIPAELGDLSNLVRLDLSFNRLTGPIPAWLGDLTNLEFLDLGTNRLTGPIPAWLGDLTNLSDLQLLGNQLTGCIPEGLRDIASNDLGQLNLPDCTTATAPDDVCATGGAVPDAANNPGLVSDCEALLAGKDTLVGTGTLNWSADVPMLNWDGVSVGNSPTRVLGLYLAEDQLTGEIPSALGDLSNLTELYLTGNRLTGEIPPELGDLSNLTELNLAENQLTGEIPSELGGLSNLTGLILNANQLTGEIPSELGGLSNLMGLILNANQLTGEIPSELGGLSNLEQLQLEGNRLTGEIPSELGGLSNLLGLILNANQLTGEIPSELGGLSNLMGLILNANQLTGEIPSELGGLSNLMALDLAGNRLTGEIPSELGGLSNLIGLWLNLNQLTGEIPSELGGLSNLDSLRLASNQLTGCIPEGLRDIASNDLGQLNLPDCTTATAPDDVCATGGAVPDAANNPGLVSDCEALLAGKDTLVGTGTLNWSADVPMLNWDGVSVGNSPIRVLRLVISKRLTGEIPPELGGLSNLTYLYLGDNQLTGEIPPELGGLSNLTGLNLSDNQLTGEIPSELGGLSNLTSLPLYANRLTGEIPSELGGLSNLELLWLHDNRLAGEIPPELGGLSNLELLWLHDNRLTGEIPSELGGLSNLEQLVLDHNQLTGEIPSELGGLSNLEQLGLSGNRLTGEIPSELGGLSNLTGLLLSGNQLTGEIPSELGGLSNLTHLWLGDNQLTGEIPSELGGLSNLTSLRLAGNQLTGCIPEGLRDIEVNDLGQLNLPDCPTATSPDASTGLTTPPTARPESICLGLRHRTTAQRTSPATASKCRKTAPTGPGWDRTGHKEEFYVRHAWNPSPKVAEQPGESGPQTPPGDQ